MGKLVLLLRWHVVLRLPALLRGLLGTLCEKVAGWRCGLRLCGCLSDSGFGGRSIVWHRIFMDFYVSVG